MRNAFGRHLLEVAIGAVVLSVTGCQSGVKPQAAAEPVLSETDKTFIVEAEQDNAHAQALGNFVKEKSMNKEIKRYADSLITTRADALEKLGVIMQKYHIPPDVGGDPQAVAQLKSLSRKALDRKFVNLTVEDQQKAISTFQQEARSAKDNDVGQYAANLLPVLESDLKKAEELQAKLNPSPKNKQARTSKGTRSSVHSTSF